MSASVYELFQAQAHRVPASAAVEHPCGSLSYAALEQAAEGLADLLVGSGLVEGELVAVMTGKGAELIAALLGIMRSGGAYVPLDPAYPDRRLAELTARIRPAAVVVHERCAARLESITQEIAGFTPLAVRCADGVFTPVSRSGGRGGKRRPVHRPAVSGLSGTPAYVFFTSGSEGAPKGVVGSGRSLDHFVRWEARQFEVTARDRFSQLGAISSDASLKDILVPLTVGASVCVPGEQASGGQALLDWIARSGITVLGCVPTLFRLILESAETRPTTVRDELRRLRLVLLAGETLKVPWVQRWMELLEERIPLANLYGATEATVYSVFHLVTTRPPDGTRVIPVGRGMDGTEILVINPGGQACAVGEIGETYLKSDYLSLGYYDDPESTRQAFVQNPLRADAPDTVYRTGDLGRILADGELEFVGRKDRQVKIRGYRADLGEIERVLATHPSLREAVVVLREDDEEPRLVAYAVPRPERSPTTSELHRYLKERLPEHMLPAAFMLLKDLPLTHNGKVDRRELPAPDQVRPALEEPYQAPRTAVEEIVAGLWAELLGLQQVGTRDDFFELGGHSLLATQLISRLRDAFGVEVPLRSLFERPTVVALAAEVEEARGAESVRSVPPMRPIPRDDELPPSFAQQRLWFLDRLEPGSAFYNIHAAIRLRGPLDQPALERSLATIVERHESLRTIFPSLDGRPSQVIAPARAMPLPVLDLGALAPPEREAEVRRLATAEACRPFDLARGPLLRFGLLRLGPSEHVALLTMHHIISDLWSCAIFVRELAGVYAAFVTGQPSPLPPLTVQYADFTHWQREWLQREVLEAQLAFWRRQLAGAPFNQSFPPDRPRPARQTFRGAHLVRRLPQALAERVVALSRRQRVTPFMVLLAAFQILLRRATDQEDVVVGTDVANRTQAETEGLIGFFVNQLVLRTDLSGNPTFAELLGRVRETALGAYDHQDLPFERLVEALNPARDPAYSPLFQVKLVLQNAPRYTLDLPDLMLDTVEIEKSTAQVDLNVRAVDSPAGLELSAEYSTDLFESSTVERILEQLELLLGDVVDRPERRLDGLDDVLDEAEHHRRLATGLALQQASLQRLRQVRRRAVPLSARREDAT